MMQITLNAILRAVFGAGDEELDELRPLLPPWVRLGSRLATLPAPKRTYGPRPDALAALAAAADTNDNALRQAVIVEVQGTRPCEPGERWHARGVAYTPSRAVESWRTDVTTHARTPPRCAHAVNRIGSRLSELFRFERIRAGTPLSSMCRKVANSSSKNTRPSSLARCAPRQKWAPIPKERCGFG